MSAQPSTIAHYRIGTKLGEGGMGVVYRAVDTKLNREVAIKVLPPAFAGDGARMQRFAREAQVLASLNHPNIASIYGVEELALVMELVEGETLSERIARGPVPIDEALPLARQMAEGLEYAHERGVVHRDLKPDNVKITPEGRVKILDFGLAKALGAETTPGDSQASPTITLSASAGAVIMGTPGYMSPEQAKGKPVDRRTDIWAFGVLLVEMLSGRELYRCETISETIASVIKDEPDLSAVPGSTPPVLRRLVKRCLTKDPLRRLQSIGEARIVLEEPSEDPVIAVPPAADKRRSFAPWLAGALAIAVAVLGGLLWRATRPIDRPLERFSVDLGPDAIAGMRVTLAISPDGTRIVYPVRTGGSGTALATRRLDQASASVIKGTEGGQDPFFSPDSKSIAFYSANLLKRISLEGGGPRVITNAIAATRGLAWGEDGTILVATPNQLFRVPDSGGAMEAFANSGDKGFYTYRWPQFLPGGQVLLTASAQGANFDEASIAVLTPKTGDLKVIIPRGGYFGHYLPSGHLLFVRQGVVYGVPFDAGRLETRGTPVPLLDDVAVATEFAYAQLAVSDTGTLAYLSGASVKAPTELEWLDSSGARTPLYSGTGEISTPQFSPDGKRLAMALAGDIAVYDLERGSMLRLTGSPQDANRYPVWAPDGKHLLFANGSGEIWWTRADGATQPVRLLDDKTGGVPTSLSPDGRHLAFHRFEPGKARDIWMLTMDLTDGEHPKAGERELFYSSPGQDIEPAFSPDGKWVAFTSTNSGVQQIFVRPFPALQGAGKWLVAAAARDPIWAPRGKQLFFTTLDGHLMVLDYTASGDAFEPGRTRPWTDTPVRMTPPFQSFSLAPDGKRFAIMPVVENKSAAGNLHANFLLNFSDELKRKLP